MRVKAILALLFAAGCTQKASYDPVADAGPDQLAVVGQIALLDGSGSGDPDGELRAWTWSLVVAPDGSTATLEAPDIAQTSFIPDLEGTYTFSLVVEDDSGNVSFADIMNVEVRPEDLPPVASLMVSGAPILGATLALDGSDSRDPEGAPLSYLWEVVISPEGSPDSITVDSSPETARFTPTVEGFYVLGLTVNDGGLSSARADVELSVGVETGNTGPTADCQGPQLVTVGTTVAVTGSGSSDPDGDPLTYAWVLRAPQGSGAALSGATQMEARFTADVEGDYIADLVVSDGQLSGSCRLDIRATLDGGNNAPVANAGTSANVAVGSLVNLDGTGSSDPDGDPITYSWTFANVPASSAITDAELSGSDTAEPSFTPDVEGEYLVVLEVCDAELCDADEVIITAAPTTGNTAPVADAGPDQTLALGAGASLDGRGSYDADGDTLTYRWELTSVPSGSSLNNGDLSTRWQSRSGFTPDITGTYTAQLRVYDGADYAYDSVDIVVSGSTGNTPPVAYAGADQTLTLGDTASVNGRSSSDADGDTLTYRWEFTSVPTGSALTNSDLTARWQGATDFTPDVVGTYTVQLRVYDGTDYAYDSVNISVSSGGGNTPPVADAGPDQTLGLGDSASLDGRGSFDADGDALSYRWEFTSVPSGSSLTNSDLANRWQSRSGFTPDVAGTYTVTLRVFDGTDYVYDSVDVVVGGSGTNTAPVADAGADQESCALAEVSLDGSGSTDADGDSLSYSWSFASVPSSSALVDADISDASSDAPSFTPDVYGSYTLTLTVDDGSTTASDSVEVLFDDQDAVITLHFDDASGTTALDDGPNGLHASLSNGEWTGGPHFGALYFDGEEVTVPNDTALDISNNWTIEWWMRPDGGSINTQTVFMRGQRYTYAMWRSSTLLTFYGLTQSGSYAYLTFNNPANDGEWHHYAITMDSANVLTLYEDGVAAATAAARSAIATSTSDLTIGAYPGNPNTYDFDGAIDEFIIRDVALTAAEVADRVTAAEQFCTGDVDVDAPSVSITAPPNNSSTDLGYVAVEGTASDASAIVSIRVDGVEAFPSSENFATWVAYVPVSSGSNTLSVDGEDWPGNISSGADSVDVSYADDCYDDYELVLTFDEDAGAGAADEGPYGLSATESGSDRALGVFGNAATFDGASYAVVPHDSALSFTGAFSLDLWYARDGASTDYEVLLGKGSLSSLNYAAVVYGDFVGCLAVDSSGAVNSPLASGFNDGDFHHVACVYDGSDLALYVDGALEDSVTVAGALLSNSSDLYIGGAGSSYGLDGAVDNVRLFAFDLTAAEVADLYAETEPCAVSANLSLAATATATQSASTNYFGDKVIDGDMTEDAYADQTYWLLPPSSTGSVTVDLGQMTGITRLRWVNTHHGPRFTYATNGYDIYVSPTGVFGGEETLVDSGNGTVETTLRYHQVDLSTPAAGRYVRFAVTSYYSLGGGINELEIFGL